MAKKGTKKKAAKKKAVKKKGTKKTGARKKTPTRRPHRKPSSKPGPVTQPVTPTATINIGCSGDSGGNCAPDKDPLKMKPGYIIKVCAPHNDVKLHFTTRPTPFVSPPTDPYTIKKGKCITLTVADDAPIGNYEYHITCSNPGCGNLAADPEMIVEG
jgi:hypothetical protein